MDVSLHCHTFLWVKVLAACCVIVFFFVFFFLFCFNSNCVRRCTGSINAEQAWIMVIYLSCKYYNKKTKTKKQDSSRRRCLRTRVRKDGTKTRTLSLPHLLCSSPHQKKGLWAATNVAFAPNFSFVCFKGFKNEQCWTDKVPWANSAP